MFDAQSELMYQRRADGRPTQVPLHNAEKRESRPQNSDDSTSDSDGVLDGTWGERDQGPPVDLVVAMEDYEALRRELTSLSHQRTRSQSRSRGQRRSSLARRVTSNIHRPQTAGTVETRRTETRDSEAGEQTQSGEEEEFQLGEFLKDGHFEKRQEGRSAKKVGVVYKNLTVQGVGATATFVKTLPSAVLGVSQVASAYYFLSAKLMKLKTFGPDLYRLAAKFIPGIPQPGASGEKRNLVHDFSGVVRDGEMLLVLGRPGSGCSTFLKAVTNKRGGFAAVTGDVSYGGIPADAQIKNYRGEVNYNEEDDQHFPTLTVW